MNLIMNFIGALVRIFGSILSALGRAIGPYCDLETATATTLIMKDSSCCSIIRIGGNRRAVGVDEFTQIMDRLTLRLTPALSQRAHTLELVFGTDGLGTSSASVKNMLSARSAAAQKLHLSLQDVLDDTAARIGSFTSEEYCYIALWTSSASIPPAEWKKIKKEQIAQTKDAAYSPDAQAHTRAVEQLLDAHGSFVDFFVRDLTALQVNCTLLDSTKALNVIRGLVDPEYTDPFWEPILPTKHGAAVRTGVLEPDFISGLSNLMAPRLADQVVLGSRRISMDESYGSAIASGHRLPLPRSSGIPSRSRTFSPDSATAGSLARDDQDHRRRTVALLVQPSTRRRTHHRRQEEQAHR